MKINIELNRESIRDFFNDAFEEDDCIYTGAFPLKLDGKIYEHFFNVRVDTRDEKVKVTCDNVFARYFGRDSYENKDFEETRYQEMEVELSVQEKMLFLVGCDAYIMGKWETENQKKTNE